MDISWQNKPKSTCTYLLCWPHPFLFEILGGAVQSQSSNSTARTTNIMKVNTQVRVKEFCNDVQFPEKSGAERNVNKWKQDQAAQNMNLKIKVQISLPCVSFYKHRFKKKDQNVPIHKMQKDNSTSTRFLLITKILLSLINISVLSAMHKRMHCFPLAVPNCVQDSFQHELPVSY